MTIRYLPDRNFPKYAFVPGRHPHPVNDPAGHAFAQTAPAVPPLDPQRPRERMEFLYAVDLFNHGYFWEAHEAWESLWHAAGRSGPVGDLLKGLIKLAAAGVKAREGNAAGVARHARRAAELLRSIEHREDLHGLWDVINGSTLLRISDELTDHPVIDATPTVEGRPVPPLRIVLGD